MLLRIVQSTPRQNLDSEISYIRKSESRGTRTNKPCWEAGIYSIAEGNELLNDVAKQCKKNLLARWWTKNREVLCWAWSAHVAESIWDGRGLRTLPLSWLHMPLHLSCSRSSAHTSRTDIARWSRLCNAVSMLFQRAVIFRYLFQMCSSQILSKHFFWFMQGVHR